MRIYFKYLFKHRRPNLEPFIADLIDSAFVTGGGADFDPPSKLTGRKYSIDLKGSMPKTRSNSQDETIEKGELTRNAQMQVNQLIDENESWKNKYSASEVRRKDALDELEKARQEIYRLMEVCKSAEESQTELTAIRLELQESYEENKTLFDKVQQLERDITGTLANVSEHEANKKEMLKKIQGYEEEIQKLKCWTERESINMESLRNIDYSSDPFEEFSGNEQEKIQKLAGDTTEDNQQTGQSNGNEIQGNDKEDNWKSDRNRKANKHNRNDRSDRDRDDHRRGNRKGKGDPDDEPDDDDSEEESEDDSEDSDDESDSYMDREDIRIFKVLSKVLKSSSNSQEAVQELKIGTSAKSWLKEFQRKAKYNDWPKTEWKKYIGKHIGPAYSGMYEELYKKHRRKSWSNFKKRFIETFEFGHHNAIARAKFKVMNPRDFDSNEKYFAECFRLAEEVGDKTGESIGLDILDKFPPVVQRRVTTDHNALRGNPSKVIANIMYAVQMEENCRESIQRYNQNRVRNQDSQDNGNRFSQNLRQQNSRYYSRFQSNRDNSFRPGYYDRQGNRGPNNYQLQNNSGDRQFTSTSNRGSRRCYHCQSPYHIRRDCQYGDMDSNRAIATAQRVDEIENHRLDNDVTNQRRSRSGQSNNSSLRSATSVNFAEESENGVGLNHH